MLRWVLIVFLIAHAVVHINVWVSKIMASQGTNPSHSLIAAQNIEGRGGRFGPTQKICRY
jgi:hypothetical protein